MEYSELLYEPVLLTEMNYADMIAYKHFYGISDNSHGAITVFDLSSRFQSVVGKYLFNHLFQQEGAQDMSQPRIYYNMLFDFGLTCSHPSHFREIQRPKFVAGMCKVCLTKPAPIRFKEANHANT